jgi:hypothetical protein
MVCAETEDAISAVMRRAEWGTCFLIDRMVTPGEKVLAFGNMASSPFG